MKTENTTTKRLRGLIIVIALILAAILVTGCPSPTSASAVDSPAQSPDTGGDDTGGGGENDGEDGGDVGDGGEVEGGAGTTDLFAVRYDANGANGGNVPIDNSSYDAGDDVTVLENAGALRRSDFIFGGWNTAADGSGTTYAPGETLLISGDITLYATWSPTEVPDDLPSDGAAVADGSGLGYLEFFYDGSNGSAFLTEAYLGFTETSYYSSNDPTIDFSFYDGSDNGFIDPGSYTLDISGAQGTVDVAIWGSPTDGTFSAYDYLAANATAQEVADFGLTVDLFDQLSSGTVDVNVDDGVYTFSWSLQTADGDTIIGTYTGTIDVGAPVWYSVEYLAPDASGGSAPTDQNEYLENDSAAILGNIGGLFRDGYTFVGWDYEFDTTTYAEGDTFDLTNITFYEDDVLTFSAVWELIPTYSVSYDANRPPGETGDVFLPNDTTQYETGHTVAVANDPLSLISSYDFVGWNTQADGSGVAYAGGDTFLMGSNDVTLYAQWVEEGADLGIGNDVVYDGNGNTGGSIPVDDTTYSVGGTVTIFGDSRLTKSGSVQVGWNTASNGSGIRYNDGDTFAFSEPTTLYAHFVETEALIDTSFNPPNIDWYTFDINSVAVQSDEKILLGGRAGDYSDASAYFTSTHNDLIRLNVDGSQDSSFNAFGVYFDYYNDGTDFRASFISGVDVGPNDEIFVAGPFDSREDVGYTFGGYMLDPDGSYDSSYSHRGTGVFGETRNSVGRYRFDSSGRLLLSSGYRHYDQDFSALIRINADGSVDSTFDYDKVTYRTYDGTSSSASVSEVELQSDGKLVIVERTADTSDYTVKRLTPSGSVDTTFTERSYAYGANVIVRADDSILLEIYDGTYDIVGLTASGAVDATFNLDLPSGTHIYDVAELPDGRIVVHGGIELGAWRSDIFILNADGSLDLSSLPAPVSHPYSRRITVTPAGDVLLWGGGLDRFRRLDLTP